MQIRELATELGVSPRMIRHYERAGLISPGRLGNGYRSFSPADVHRLKVVRDMIASGFSTREIRHFIQDCLDDRADNAGGDPAACVRRLEGKLTQIDQAIEAFIARRETLLSRLDFAKARVRARSRRGKPSASQRGDDLAVAS